MHVPLVIDVRHSWFQRIDSRAPDSSWLALARRLNHFPVGHLRFADRLAIDRPRTSVIVGIRLSGVPVHVGAYAETQFRIFVNHLTVRRFFVDIGRKKPFILENLPHQIENLSPSCGTGVGFQKPPTLRCKLIQRKTHDPSSSRNESELPLTKRQIILNRGIAGGPSSHRGVERPRDIVMTGVAPERLASLPAATVPIPIPAGR